MVSAHHMVGGTVAKARPPHPKTASHPWACALVSDSGAAAPSGRVDLLLCSAIRMDRKGAWGSGGRELSCLLPHTVS
jgi:hypothetical protein